MTTKHDGCAVCVAVKEVLVYISLYACVPRWVQFSLTWVQSNRIVFQLGGMSTTSMEFNCEPRKVGPNSRPLKCQVTSRSTVDLCIRIRYYTCWVQKSRVTTPSWGVSRWFPLPLFMPSMIRCSVEPSDPLALDETSFSASEAEHALRSLHKRAAPGPDGITMQELKKISLAAQALIMRNW